MSNKKPSVLDKLNALKPLLTPGFISVSHPTYGNTSISIDGRVFRTTWPTAAHEAGDTLKLRGLDGNTAVLYKGYAYWYADYHKIITVPEIEAYLKS